MTYWASNAHLNKEDDLLPWCQRTQVDGGEPTHGDGANAVEQGVNVGDFRGSVAGVEYPREYERRKGTVDGLTSALLCEMLMPLAASRSALTRRVYESYRSSGVPSHSFPID